MSEIFTPNLVPQALTILGFVGFLFLVIQALRILKK